MSPQIGRRSQSALLKRVVGTILCGVPLVVCWPAAAALESAVYQTLPGATVPEWGDRVQDGGRVIPFPAALTFDLSAAVPSLTAVLPSAVLEGGEPFPLTVRSSSGVQLTDGTYMFEGDYLRDIHPSGTQYLFDWRFSTLPDGRVVWNGIIGWAGGHLWQIRMSDLTIVPDTTQPKLDLTRAGSLVTVSWPAASIGYRLEQAAGLPATDWNAVTNAVATTGDRFAVTIEAAAAQSFFRLSRF